MSEEKLIEIRRQKHQQANGGTYPLATSSVTIDDVVGNNLIGRFKRPESDIKTTIDFNDLKNESFVFVHGRIINFRKTGAITFLKIKDSTDSVQLIASKAAFEDYANLSNLDLGDIIEVEGKIVFSKTKELSILIAKLNLLSKAIRPLPEKYHGINDTELKYRKRYLDLLCSDESKEVFRARTVAISSIRSYLQINDFVEVETSTLNYINSGANAKPFKTHHNALNIDLNLRIAPELYLKRLIVGGFDKVFEIGRNYRNEGLSTRHNPEFTMLEFYQAYGKFSYLVQYAKDILREVDRDLFTKYQAAPSTRQAIYNNWVESRTFSLSHFEEVPMWDATVNACAKAGLALSPGVHPLIDGPPVGDHLLIEVTDINNERLKRINIQDLFDALSNTDTAMSNGKIIGTLFEHVAEPFLTEDYRTEDGKLSVCVFITQFPTALCPLARAMDKAPALCERFELYIDGKEIANAFQELNNPDEQHDRFVEQLESNQRDAMDIDNDYVEALEYGMPPTIGLGLGIDRLVMLLTNSQSIKDVILFPAMKPLNEK
jgi:lysyl-tRNA synthetase, class II